MYYSHFGLTQPPFKITPNTDFFYAGGERGAILEALIYAITHGEGIVKVTGEVGSGKTMLCRMLQDRLPPQIETIYLANPNVSPEDILHAIAHELQLPVTSQSSRLEVLQALHQHLLTRHEENKRVVLFIEEAQGMPLQTLEEIRLLTNLETRHDKLLQIVMFGQPELDANIGQTHIRQLRERITHSFVLPPLKPSEVHEYLTFRLRAAGYHGPDLFALRVVRRIAAASQGLTRRINLIADKALLAAFADNTHNVSAGHVRAAIRDSEFSNKRRWPTGWIALTATALLAAGVGGGWAVYAPQPSPAQPARAATPAPAPVATAIKSAPLPTQPPAPMVMSVAANPLDERLEATQSWLAAQPPGTISIQLLGGDDPAQLRRDLAQVSRLLEQDRIFVFRTEANGKPSLTMLYGSYPDRAQAQQALVQLPEQLKQHQPYLRSVQGIRDEIRKEKPE
jgi:type II secretory pathway predicted ATPase ExeA